MNYKFADRTKEWTTYVGLALAGLAAALPSMVPATDVHWLALWQAAQYILGAALVFIPQTAGTQTVEREGFALLKAFAAELPPEYAAALRPALNMLSQAVMQVSTGAPIAPPSDPNRVVATPITVAPPPPSPLPEPVPGAPQ